MDTSYYKSKDSVKEYITMAKDVNSSQLIEKLRDFLSKGSSILEIGSGPGTDFRLLAKDFMVTGSDFSAEFLEYLHANNPNCSFLKLNAITLDTPKKFDGIYSNKVLQHLNDKELEQSIVQQIKILNPKGIICHSFWKGKGNEIYKGLLVNYQDENSLKALFENDFEILLLEEYKEFDAGDSIVFIGMKK